MPQSARSFENFPIKSSRNFPRKFGKNLVKVELTPEYGRSYPGIQETCLCSLRNFFVVSETSHGALGNFPDNFSVSSENFHQLFGKIPPEDRRSTIGNSSNSPKKVGVRLTLPEIFPKFGEPTPENEKLTLGDRVVKPLEVSGVSPSNSRSAPRNMYKKVPSEDWGTL